VIKICLTPVKNEAWILDKFLAATSFWADYIIIADQNSTDGSLEIAKRYEKVILINNPSSEFNEPERQKLLLSEARKIKGKKLLITLDADEIFTSDFQQTAEWQQILNANEGDVFGFEWVNVMPGFKKAWINKGPFPWAIIDDGSEHSGKEIHSPRIPISESTKITTIKTFKVLHLQYLNWARMQSKHNYYQCLERIKYPAKAPVDIYRMYHHMDSISKSNLIDILPEWINEYENKGIQLTNLKFEKRYWFDDEVEQLLSKHGSETFKREAIWEKQWSHKDPRNMLDKAIQLYLKTTQPFSKSPIVKKIDRQLRFHYRDKKNG
jgi:glycosyltransferase involved in cell wall biosynthesis